ncbi:MAG: phage antirepressor KilAC domain-containing protein [Bacilli bacterium]|nr:phage antirepressor KilAC domain-containing protein [Bacilli bacterium]
MANEIIKKEQYSVSSQTADIVTSPFGDIRRECCDDEYWMCAQDACKLLGYKDALKSTATIVNRQLDNADITKCLTSSSGQKRTMLYINAHGFLKLCLGSTLQNAKEIQDWFINSFFNNQKRLLMTSSDIKSLVANPEFIPALLPELLKYIRKIGYANMAELLECSESFFISDLGKFLNIKNLGPGNMYKYFLSKKYTFKRPNDNGTYPNQRFVDKGWLVLEFSTFRKPNGDVCKTAVTKITPKGLLGFAYKIYSEEEEASCNSRPLIPLMK